MQQRKYSIAIDGHKTSVAIEPEFWYLLARLARRREQSVPQVVRKIRRDNPDGNFARAIRLFVLRELVCRLEQIGNLP